ncbi:MAG: NUDIX domain-containing protein [Pseudomonadota bacterium]
MAKKQKMWTTFIGAKLALFLGRRLLVYRRDDRPDIPWPNTWDLPGGGREPGEGPWACAQRETFEEFGLRVPRTTVTKLAHHRLSPTGEPAVFVVAHMPPSCRGRIKFGEEGQHWKTMSRHEFLRSSKAIPHLQHLVAKHG